MTAIKVNKSKEFDKKIVRLKNLPKLIRGALSGLTKRELLEIKKTFHDGISNNSFGLDKLVDLTIADKKSKGYSKPKTPLYGKGDSEGDRSYANMLNIFKLKNGWRLRPSTKKHWSGKIKLNELFKIHENGAIIEKATKKGTKRISIPPRPALHLAYRRYLIKKRKGLLGKELRQAITDYINTGNAARLKILDKFNQGLFAE